MDNVNHPKHYTTGSIEVWDFIIDQKLDYCLGNAVKYICRIGRKGEGKEVEDIDKAIAYLRKVRKKYECIPPMKDRVATKGDIGNICSYLHENGYTHIGRDGYGSLRVFVERPKMSGNSWAQSVRPFHGYDAEVLSNMFSDIEKGSMIAAK